MSDLIYQHRAPDGSELSVTADIDGIMLYVKQAGGWNMRLPIPVEQAEILQLCLEKYIVDAARSSMRAALAMHLAGRPEEPKDKGCGGECGSCGSCGHE